MTGELRLSSKVDMDSSRMRDHSSAADGCSCCDGAARRAPRNTCNTRGCRRPTYPRFGLGHNRYALRRVIACDEAAHCYDRSQRRSSLKLFQTHSALLPHLYKSTYIYIKTT